MVLVPGGFHYAIAEAVVRRIPDAETQLLTESLVTRELREQVAARNTNDKSLRRKKSIKGTCRNVVGAIQVDKQQVLVGYDERDRAIGCLSGLLPGTLWLEIRTNDLAIGKVPCLGPLTALVAHYDGLNFTPSDSQEVIAKKISDCILKDEAYQQSLRRALELWQKNVAGHWNVDHRIDELRYRFSYLRHDSKKYKVSRQQVLSSAGLCSTILPVVVHGEKKWKVNLTDYHLEVVILQRESSLAIVLALRPYQLHAQNNAVSFANGGLPTDITPPFIPTHEIVRLRPTTASILLEQAQCQQGDIVLDPCAGIGTIPIISGATALGGDLILGTSANLHQVATDYLAATDPKQSPNLLAWDASLLPLRTGSVDVVVSDLPFGRQCSSSSKLDQLFPLVVAELTRVVRRDSGRMVLLCGSYIPILEALKSTNAWDLPCKAIFPVSISGNSAWVIAVNRNSSQTERDEDYLRLTKSFTKKRDDLARIRACGPPGKKRKEQA